MPNNVKRYHGVYQLTHSGQAQKMRARSRYDKWAHLKWPDVIGWRFFLAGVGRIEARGHAANPSRFCTVEWNRLFLGFVDLSPLQGEGANGRYHIDITYVLLGTQSLECELRRFGEEKS